MKEMETFYSVSLSDSVLAACCYFSCSVLWGRHDLPSLGFLLSFIAASLGALRYAGLGFLERPHVLATSVSKLFTLLLVTSPFVLPMVTGISSFAPYRVSLPYADVVLDLTSMHGSAWSVVLAAVPLALSSALLSAVSPLGTLVSVASVLASLYYACTVGNTWVAAGAVTTLAAGALGTSFQSRIMGVRKVDWFHFAVAAAYLFYATALDELYVR